jgi:predicted nucleic acid-binding protein
VYLLDTDHCSRLIEGDPGVIGRLEALGNALVATSIALHHNLTVVSADSDFERMRQAREFPLERWWSPA